MRRQQAMAILVSAVCIYLSARAMAENTNVKKGPTALQGCRIQNGCASNVAVGFGAQQGDNGNCTGPSTPSSCCTGYLKGRCNQFGSFNVAIGEGALLRNQIANQNVATGADALGALKSGDGNVAVGLAALAHLDGGADNIAVGRNAGIFATGGSHNIFVGNQGNSSDNGEIRIGTPGTHVGVHLAGVYGSGNNGTGALVYVDNTGHLGTSTSSARYKEDIHDMGSSTNAMMKLRPVRFRYKKDFDTSGLQQYGLIAEEVAKVYPELVMYDDQGRPQTVRYNFLDSMLLNEVQKQARQLAAQKRQIEALQEQLRTQVRESNDRVAALAGRLETIEAAVSQRAPLREAAYDACPHPAP
jgi:hypothetical protein